MSSSVADGQRVVKKRKIQDEENKASEQAKEFASPLQATFDGYRAAIDARNDQRERIIKSSRDLTRMSKKVIVSLQQATNENKRHTLITQAKAQLKKLTHIVADMMKDLPTMSDYFRFQRSFTSGIQEFIEALSFLHYLEHGTLISHKTTEDFINDNMCGDTEQGETGTNRFVLMEEDFILGILDLSGELMRFATTYSTSGQQMVTSDICAFLQDFYSLMKGLKWKHKEAGKKIKVVGESLMKVEALCGKMLMQKSEYPDVPEHILRNMLSGPSLESNPEE